MLRERLEREREQRWGILLVCGVEANGFGEALGLAKLVCPRLQDLKIFVSMMMT